MLKKIFTPKLLPGMRIVESGMQAEDHPHLYSADVEATAELIEQIIHEGFRDVFIDTERSNTSMVPQDMLLEEGFDKILSETHDYVPPEISLNKEMATAKKIYAATLELAHTYMDAIRRGDQVNLHKAKPVVERILESVGNNPDALLGLCKLCSVADYNYTHSVNVSVLAVMYAKHMSLPHEIQYAAGMAGLFHDLGKAMIPIELLNAPRNLSEEEFAILKRHPRLSYEHVKKTPGFTQDILLGIYDHHERFNGTGYPRGIAGHAISVPGRIISIADVYDAISSRRPYKDAMLPHRVLGIMYQMRGEDFYPGYMEHFIRMLGIYPIGSVVEMNNGNIGVVSASNSAMPTKPKVLILRDSRGPITSPKELDTSKGNGPSIVKCLTESESPFDPAKALGIR